MNTLVLPKDLEAALMAQAKEKGVSLNTLVVDLLTSVAQAKDKDDTLMTKEEFFAKLERAERNIEQGNYTEVRTRRELHAFLDSL